MQNKNKPQDIKEKCICGKKAKDSYASDGDFLDWCGKPACAILLEEGEDATFNT